MAVLSPLIFLSLRCLLRYGAVWPFGTSVNPIDTTRLFMKYLLLSLFVGPFLLGAGVAAQAQSQPSLEVTVTDLLLRRPVAGTVVYLQDLSRQTLDSVQTNAQGRALFGNVSALNRYRTFTRRSKEYTEEEVSDIVVKEGGTTTVTLELPLRRESTLEEVVINDRRLARMNTQNAEVSALVSKRELAGPSARRPRHYPRSVPAAQPDTGDAGLRRIAQCGHQRAERYLHQLPH